MTYLEVRKSGRPFNRRKYKDGWYIHDLHRSIDYAKIDLSQRFWTQVDLEADDWWTERDQWMENVDKELTWTDYEKERE